MWSYAPDVEGDDDPQALSGAGQVVFAYGGNDTIVGSGYGQETFFGGAGDDAIDGDGGPGQDRSLLDRALYAGRRSDYRIEVVEGSDDGAGRPALRIVDLRDGSPDGTDTVIRVERFEFDSPVGYGSEVFSYEDLVDPPNRPPTAAQVSPASVAENAAAGEVVGSLVGIDPDDGDAFTFALLDDAGGAFAISGGSLVVADPSRLDFEGERDLTIRLRVTDAAGASAENDWTIAVADVVDTPVPQDATFPDAVGEDAGSFSGRLPAPGGVVVGTPRYVLGQVLSGGGNVVVAADGSFTVTPAANFGGVLSFSYRVGDDANEPSSLHEGLAQVEVGRASDGATLTTFPISRPSQLPGTVSGIALAQLVDLDGSEEIVGGRITGVRPGITFSFADGGPPPTDEGDGTFSLSAAQANLLTNLQAHLPAGIASGVRTLFRLSVEAGERTLPGERVTSTAAVVGTFTPTDLAVTGGAGDDALATFDGNDVLVGLGGNDVLSGAQGADRLVGDGGATTFGSASAGATVPSTGAALALTLATPEVADGATAEARVLVARGGVAQLARFVADRSQVNVAVVVDTSGSMANPFGGAAIPDANGDGRADQLIDGAIAGVASLLDWLDGTAGLGNARLGLIRFSTGAATAYAGAVGADSDGDGVRDAEEVARTFAADGATDFKAALDQAAAFFAGRPSSENYVFFLSDGEPTGEAFAAAAAALRDPNGTAAAVRAIGLGTGASLADLDLLDDGIANGSAVRALNPAELQDALFADLPTAAEIDRVDLLVDGAASGSIAAGDLVVTPLGLVGAATLAGLTPGADDVVTARLVASDPDATTVAVFRTVGGSGNDRLDGGPGRDTMAGGAGDDVYRTDRPDDVVDETDGAGGDAGGTDLVRSTASFALPDFVENLRLLGAGALDGTGNGLDNVLTGAEGANHLRGLGGADTLEAGAGEDTLEGGDGDDLLNGREGADRLVGGAGFDTLIGGVDGDRDAFVFAAPGLGRDTIREFTRGIDVIELSGAGFGLAPGATPVVVVDGPLPAGVASFTFASATARLSFDEDGAGGAGPVLLARLPGLTSLSGSDFVVVA